MIWPNTREHFGVARCDAEQERHLFSESAEPFGHQRRVDDVLLHREGRRLALNRGRVPLLRE